MLLRSAQLLALPVLELWHHDKVGAEHLAQRRVVPMVVAVKPEDRAAAAHNRDMMVALLCVISKREKKKRVQK